MSPKASKPKDKKGGHKKRSQPAGDQAQAEAMSQIWVTYSPQGQGYIPISQWGVDHWQTLAYLETRAVDFKGIIDNRHMRTNPRLHRNLVGSLPLGGIQDGSRYPTRLREGEQYGHDDWSCLEDMAAIGLLKAYVRIRDAGAAFGGYEARIDLTPLGLEFAAHLRGHKATGGTYHNFCRLESEWIAAHSGQTQITAPQ